MRNAIGHLVVNVVKRGPKINIKLQVVSGGCLIELGNCLVNVFDLFLNIKFLIVFFFVFSLIIRRELFVLILFLVLIVVRLFIITSRSFCRSRFTAFERA